MQEKTLHNLDLVGWRRLILYVVHLKEKDIC